MPPDNESATLPEPPPPRQIARDAAIEAAMQRFDGDADLRRRVPWSRRPQVQLAIAASLVLAIGLPATLISIRDNGGIPGTTSPPTAQAPAKNSVVPSLNLAPEAPSDAMKVPSKPTTPAPISPPQLQAPTANAPAPAAPMAERQVSAERDEIAPPRRRPSATSSSTPSTARAFDRAEERGARQRTGRDWLAHQGAQPGGLVRVELAFEEGGAA
jgi:hypothetical protein